MPNDLKTTCIAFFFSTAFPGKYQVGGNSEYKYIPL